MNSFKRTMSGSSHGYNQVEEATREDHHRRKSRRKTIVIVSSTVLLIGIVIAIAVTVSRSNSSQSNTNPKQTSISSTIRSICSNTMYPGTCISTLSSVENSSHVDLSDLFKVSLEAAIDKLVKLSPVPEKLARKDNDGRLQMALTDCKELFKDAVDQVNGSLSSMDSGKVTGKLGKRKWADLRTWLSTAITDLDTCLDGLEGTRGNFKGQMVTAMNTSKELTSITLSIATGIAEVVDYIPVSRRLLMDGDFPAWVTSKERSLLGNSKFTPDLIVAKDGSGNFSSITDAVAAVPKKSDGKFVIYVKKGVYLENVEVDKKTWNLVMIGDGRNSTIISGSLNNVDGISTFKTATFIAAGKGFMARDIGFKNTAGPQKHQAVALRSSADMSVFHRCDMDAYQDTLYAHSNRQFYRKCSITGTVDFIFGNAAVVLQNCDIAVRQPMENQKNTITAQGKTEWNQTTGILIQGCQITATGNMTAKTYLGRPWKPYSTTVIMESTIGQMIDPEGWLSWSGNQTESPPETIFYAEYRNSGPGSGINERVKWKGYKSSISSVEAKKFSVDSFIQGSEWIPSTGVDFTAS